MHWDTYPSPLLTNKPTYNSIAQWTQLHLPLLEGGQGKLTLIDPHPIADSCLTLTAGRDNDCDGLASVARDPATTPFQPLHPIGGNTGPLAWLACPTRGPADMHPQLPRDVQHGHTLAPGPPHGNIINGLAAPTLNDRTNATGATTPHLRIKNKHHRLHQQAAKPCTAFWTTYCSEMVTTSSIDAWPAYQNVMCAS